MKGRESLPKWVISPYREYILDRLREAGWDIAPDGSWSTHPDSRGFLPYTGSLNGNFPLYSWIDPRRSRVFYFPTQMGMGGLEAIWVNEDLDHVPRHVVNQMYLVLRGGEVIQTSPRGMWSSR